MRKITAIAAALVMALSMAACGQSEVTSTTAATAEATTAETTAAEATTADVTEADPETITIKSLDVNKETIDLEVPYKPERIAILDMAALDIIDSIGEGDAVVGTASTSIDYLLSYVENEEIANLGTIKEADLEAVMACEPDIIFIGGRLASNYDALSEIAPVVYLAADTELGLIESTKNNAVIIASIFGKDSEIEDMLSEFDDRIAALQEAAAGKTAIVGMTTSGSFNLLGNDGRCSIIGVEIGYENLSATETTSTHGNESSFETVVSLNPDYIFVMDRDSAIGTEGAQLAQEIMNNELINALDAAQNNQIIYLAHPAIWYTAEGGINSLDVMLSDLEEGLGLK